MVTRDKPASRGKYLHPDLGAFGGGHRGRRLLLLPELLSGISAPRWSAN